MSIEGRRRREAVQDRIEIQRRREAAQDRTLLRFGAVAAIFSATGAAALMLTPGEPGLRSLQHLALFAQPSRGRVVRPEPARAVEEAPQAGAIQETAQIEPEPRPDLAPQPTPRFARPATPSPQLASASGLVDPPTVGAIDDQPTARLSARAAATPLSAWRVYDVVGERVLLAGPSGVAWVKAGVDLGAAGVVARVDLDRGGVTVTTSRGAIRRR